MNNTGHKCLNLAIVLGSHSFTSRSWHVLTSSRLDKKKAWLFLLSPKRALLEHRLTGKRGKKTQNEIHTLGKKFLRTVCGVSIFRQTRFLCVQSKPKKSTTATNTKWPMRRLDLSEQSNLAPPRPAKPFYHSINCGDGGAKKSMHARYLGEFAHKPVPSKYWKRYAFS